MNFIFNITMWGANEKFVVKLICVNHIVYITEVGETFNHHQPLFRRPSTKCMFRKKIKDVRGRLLATLYSGSPLSFSLPYPSLLCSAWLDITYSDATAFLDLYWRNMDINAWKMLTTSYYKHYNCM